MSKVYWMILHRLGVAVWIVYLTIYAWFGLNATDPNAVVFESHPELPAVSWLFFGAWIGILWLRILMWLEYYAYGEDSKSVRGSGDR